MRWNLLHISNVLPTVLGAGQIFVSGRVGGWFSRQSCYKKLSGTQWRFEWIGSTKSVLIVIKSTSSHISLISYPAISHLFHSKSLQLMFLILSLFLSQPQVLCAIHPKKCHTIQCHTTLCFLGNQSERHHQEWSLWLNLNE